MKRTLIDCIVLYHKTGMIEPLYIVWTDGVRYPCSMVSCEPAVRVGETGLRYTVKVGEGQTRHLFLQEGRWYLESPDYYY